jgi:hypothetical protein
MEELDSLTQPPRGCTIKAKDALIALAILLACTPAGTDDRPMPQSGKCPPGFTISRFGKFCWNDKENWGKKILDESEPERRALFDCLLKSARSYASRTCEAADIIVEAAYGNCAPQEKQYRQAFARAADELYEEQDAKIEGARKGHRRFILKTILDTRTELGNCTTERDTR